MFVFRRRKRKSNKIKAVVLKSNYRTHVAWGHSEENSTLKEGIAKEQTVRRESSSGFSRPVAKETHWPVSP